MTKEVGEVAQGDLAVLDGWFRWYGRVATGLGVFFLVLFVAGRSPASAVIGAFLLLAVVPAIQIGLGGIGRGRPVPALILASASLWGIVLVVGARGSTALVGAMPLIAVPMILAMSHVRSRVLLRFALGAVVVCAVSAALALAETPLIPSSLSESTLALIVVPVAALTTGLAALSLWHVASSLRSSLVQTEAANEALAKSERSLELKVEERTSELEKALTEISTIQNLVQTVSSTLDPQAVLQEMLEAIRPIVAFDQSGVMLLDETGETLVNADAIGAGFSPEVLDRIRGMTIPTGESRSAFAYVLRRNRPYLLREIDERTVEAMSPGDRRFYEANPPRGLLICPLEIEQKAVGLLYLGKTDTGLQLDREDIASIQTYVAHLSGALRNAQLFNETQLLNQRLAEAEERLGQMSESAADSLDDVETWASNVADEIAAAIGSPEIAVWVRSENDLEKLTGSTNVDLTAHDLETLNKAPESLRRRGDRVVPSVGVTGELVAALVVADGTAPVGKDGERLLQGFASQLGSTLELARMRRELDEAEERRRATAEEMLSRGIELLRVCRSCGRCYDQDVEICEDDQTILDEPQPFPYRVAGRYRLLAKVDEGAMGNVFRAQDERLEREVAVKVIKSEIFNREDMRVRFEREARAVARVDHPGVVAVFDYGAVEEGSLYIVMEFLHGLDLRRVLRQQGAGRPRDVATLVRQAGAALAAAHTRGLVHRDIKPANIFLTAGEGGLAVKLLDFGVAKEMSLDAAVTQTGMIVGTPRFMAPEQLLGKPVDERSDVYSLAAVAFQALTGESLVRAEDFAQVLVEVMNQPPPKVSAILAQAPKQLDELFEQALAKDSDERPSSVLEWSAELSEALMSMRIERPGWHIAPAPQHDLPADIGGDETTLLT